MAKATPKLKREALTRYQTLIRDHNKMDAQAMVAEEFGVSVVTVRLWIRKAKDNGQTFSQDDANLSIPVYSPKIEHLSSSDFEIHATPITQPPSRRIAGCEHHLRQDRNERWLILPDMQVPYHDQRTFDAVLQYARTVEWDGFIQLGDFMDWDFISRWSKENARAAERQRFFEHYQIGNAVLDRIQEAVRHRNPDAKGVVIEGNHDYRIEDWINRVPAMEGIIEMEANLRFSERRMTYWKYWQHKQPFIIGKAWFIHGEYIGTHHAKKTADSFHRNVFYGHTHDRQLHTKTTVSEDSVQCESFGTLSVRELEYMGRKPSNWIQTFAEFFFRPDGHFNHYVTNIIGHRFIAIDGKEYQG